MSANDYAFLKIGLKDPADILPSVDVICKYVYQNYQTRITSADVAHLENHLVIRLCLTGSRSELGLPKSDTINGVVYKLTECDKEDSAHLFNMDEMNGSEGERATVLVTGLPKSFKKEFVELYFENEAKSGGGPIRAIVPEPGPAPCRALITFVQAHVAQRVVSKGQMTVKQCEMRMCWPPPWDTVQLTGLPADMDEDDIELVLTSPKYGALSEIVKLTKVDGKVHVKLDSEQAAQAFAKRGSFQYKNEIAIELLRFELPEEACGGSPSKEHSGKKEQATRQLSEFRCVIVSGFPQMLSTEQLELVFESEVRSGGGPLECPIEVNNDHLLLAITYESTEVAARVVSRSPLKYKNYSMTIVPAPGNIVQVSGVGGDIDSEDISLLLTSKRCGFASVDEVIDSHQAGTFYAVMTTDDDAQKVIGHSGIVYNNSELSFTLMKFGLPPNAGSQPPDVEPKSPNAGRQSPNAGRKSPNAGRKSPNAGHKSPNAGRKTPNAGRKPPAIGPKPSVAGRKSQVAEKAAEPDKSAESEKDAESEGESQSAQDTIVVRGVTNDIERDLKNLMENTGRSGGGPVKAFNIDTSLGQALVTFTNAADASRVIDRKEALVLRNVTLTVTWPPPANTVKITGFTGTAADHESLILFLETSKFGSPHIASLKPYPDGTIYAVMDTEQQAADVASHGSVNYLSDQLTLELMRFFLPPSDQSEGTTYNNQATILVKGISDHDTDSSLKLFFENERRNDGGHLAGDLIINRDLQAAVVTFEHEEVAARMIQKQSVEFQGHMLEIGPAPPRNMVLLDDVPPSLHLDTVTNAMDNYGVVADIWPSCQPGQLVVFFENEQDAIELATKSEVEVTNVKLKVSQLKFGLMAKGGGSLLCRTVLVSNIPASVQEKDLKVHLASIGGQIERYQPVPNSPRCLVTFTDHKGAKSVVDKKKTKLSGMELYFAWPVLEPEWHKGRQPQELSRSGLSSQSGDGQPGQSLGKQSDQSREDQSNGGQPDQSGDQSQSRGEQVQTQGGEQPMSVLYVYGIPASMHDDVIRNYCSNRRNGGGPVDKMDRSDAVTCIHFKQAQVASQLAAKGSVEVSKHTLQVSLTPRKLQQQSVGGAAGGGEGGAVVGGTTVTLKGFKAATHDDTIKDYIQNRKVAGSKTIKEFTRSGSTATIVFNEAAVAEKVSKMRQLSLEGATITATLVQPPEQPTTDVVVVKGLSADITDDALMNALELHLCDDCEVKEIKRLSTTDALVTFTDAQSGKVALERKKFTLQGKTVTFHPHTQSQAVDKGESVDTEPIRTLMLTGFKPKTDRNKLTYFFETKRKSGGGDIADLMYNDDEQCATVTFMHEEDARGVLAMKPLMFEECKLKATVLVTLVDEEGKPVKSHTIVVSGLTDKVSKDSLIMVLEAKRKSGGGAIVESSVYMDKSAGKAVVAFMEAAAAERVSQKQKLEVMAGCWVTVNLLPARPLQRVLGETYPTVAVVKHFREDCPTRALKAFLQKKSQTTVTDIEYSLRPSVAMVYFDRTPDFRAIQVHCARYPCGGAMLSVTQVPVSDTVQVFGVQGVDPDWLEEYFANNSKSGGGEVSKFEMRSEENVALVSFVDKEVALKLSERQECTVRNIHMQNSLYHADMGIIPADHDSSKPGIIIPTHTDIPVANDKLMGFIVKTEVFKKNVEKLVKKLYATVDWNASEKLRSKLRVLCTLKHNVPKVQELVKTWKQSVEAEMDKVLQDNVAYHKQDVMSRFWTPLLQQTRKDTEKAQADSNDMFVVYYDDKSCCIEVVGLTDYVDPTVKRLQEALHALEAEAERLSKTMTETLKLKTCHVVLLDQLGVFAQLKQQFPDITLDVNTKTATVSVTGLLDNVRKIKLEVNNKTQNIVEQSVNIAPEFKPLFDDVLFKRDVTTLFESDQLTVGWEVVDCGMLVCAMDANIVQMAAKLVAANVVPRHNTYDDASAAMFKKENWIQFKKRTIELKNDDEGVVYVSYSDTYNALLFSGESITSPVIATMNDSWHTIDFYGLKTNVNAAAESVNEYLGERAVYDQFHETSLGVAKLLAKNYRAEIDTIENGYKGDLPVKIAIMDAEYVGFVIRGKEARIEAATGKMWELVDQICHETLLVDQPDAVRYLQTPAGKNSLYGLEKQYPVVIIDADDDRSSTKAGNAAMGGEANTEVCYAKIKNSVGSKYIYVLKTDLAKVDCDAIVNAANNKLRLGAGAAGAIKSLGGPKIQEECDKYISERGPLSVGEVFISTGGNLKCKKVIHAVGPHYKGGKMNEENDLHDTVYNCLEEACRLKLESIAMPAISSGVFGFPITLSVKLTVEAVGDFFEHKAKDKVRVSLKKVYLVNNVAQGVRIFMAELCAVHKGDVKIISDVKDDDLRPAGTFIPDEQGSEHEYEEHHVMKDSDDEAGARDWHGRTSLGGMPVPVQASRFVVSELSKKNSITYVIYGKQQQDVDCVKREILKNCDDSTVIKKIAGEYSELIGQLNQQQIMSVKAVESVYRVSVTITQGCIEIKGLHNEVSEATSAIHSILARAREEKFAVVLTAEIQWLYEDAQGQYKEYSPQAIAKIEEAYQQKQLCRIKLDANESYQLDFEKMVQTSTVNGKERRIWRKTSSASSINLPHNWTKMGQEHYVQIELKSSDDDYRIVSTAFTSTGGPNTILKIYRIQNPHLYQTYMVMKKHMERTGRTNTIETRPLWHGTAAPTVAFICTRYFDRSFCGKNATPYGRGVYFAVQAVYSAQPFYSPPEPGTNNKYMFCCRVLTGDYVQGNQTMNVPPVKSGTQPIQLYDTLVDNPIKPTMFITFNDSQAYPDFLIVFR